MNQKKCSVCYEEFGCGAGFKPGSCWCVSFPPIMPLEFDQDCRCPACLSKSIDSQIGELINKNGVDRMLTLAEPYRNQSELVKDVDFRVVNDLYVFSKWYHIKRGECCGNDCQNCPY